MADLVTKLSNIPPIFLRDFLAPEEEDTRFLNVLEEEFIFVSAICIYSRRKLAKIGDYFELTVPRYHCKLKSTTVELLIHLLAPSEHIHLVAAHCKKNSR